MQVRRLLPLLALHLAAGGCAEDCPRWEQEPLDPRISRVESRLGISKTGEIFYPAPDDGESYSFEVVAELKTPLYGLAGLYEDGLVVGAKGAVFVSPWPNTTWERATTPPIDESLLAVRFACRRTNPFVQPEIAIAVGERGRILRSTTTGRSWELTDSTTARTLRSVEASIGASERVAVAVGDAGAIVRSEDDGATWSVIASGTDVDLAWIDFVSACDAESVDPDDPWPGYAVGTGGTVLKSLDEGLTWQPIDLGIPDDMRQIHVHSDTRILGDGRLWVLVEGSDRASVLHDFGQTIDWYSDRTAPEKAGGEGRLFWYRSPGYCSGLN
ncbi:WD40/YVTN/BNR-like repeat-containing protein [Nannocystis bainbridge]|uniref:Photosynthesis system II assembly factor Ycf48/Hcf136-like domain-containing protein n=1 Tax=Nannocystis bainbridge TaxID=2995303 RepID=A0ABT5DWT4_9BACT|nr:hypothetical protein [Nannocystis bainbridge]MDC0717183.1 hypothetical protein [Nannocystis bainbridge]